MKSCLFILSVTTLLICCHGPAKNKKENSKKVFDLEVGRKEINDIKIAFEGCTRPDTTLLFIHGWCIDKSYWFLQQVYFCDKYNVIALDLPGFGESGKNRTNWTFDQYADDINQFIKEQKLKNVILIGHSMSGDILLLVDTKYPESIIGIVGIDNLKSPGTKNTEQQTKEVEHFFAALDSNFSGTVEGYSKNYLFPLSADTSIVNRVVKDIKANDSVIAIKVLRSAIDVYQKEKDMMQQLTHKLYLVNSDFTSTEIDSLKKYCKASAEVVYITGTGHYPMIEKPAEFNAALQKVIWMIGGN